MADEQPLDSGSGGLKAKGPIVVKRTKILPAPPHGGAWKVAYADFVTAMMAFFLLLWLLNVTTESTKQGISDFYEPVGISKVQTGSGGAMAGLSLNSKEALKSPGSPPSVKAAMPTFGSVKTGSADERERVPEPREGGDTKGADSKRDKLDNEQFETTAESLRKAIQEISEISDLRESLLIGITPEGLRILLFDHQNTRLFASGNSILTEKGERLFAIISSILRDLPHHLRITGHTGRGENRQQNYSNWELSSDRANSVRKTLTKYRIDPRRIERIAGRADQELLDPKIPDSPRNSRIDILLIRHNKNS